METTGSIGGYIGIMRYFFTRVYYWGYIVIMEKKMETAILYRVYVGVI